MRCEAIDAPAPARTDQLACVECGCTERAACRMADGGGCSWVSLEPPLCSACVSEEDMDEALAGFGVSRSGVYGAELCPASQAPAPHAQIWIDESSGYCARCRQGFMV